MLNGKLFLVMQGQEETDELNVKLQEMCQLHEQTLSELQSLKSANEDILEAKVQLTYDRCFDSFLAKALVDDKSFFY